jgi:hypothetical protein
VGRLIDGEDFRLTALAGANRTDYTGAIVAAKYVLPKLRTARTEPLAWWVPGVDADADDEALTLVSRGHRCPEYAESWVEAQLHELQHFAGVNTASTPELRDAALALVMTRGLRKQAALVLRQVLRKPEAAAA